MGVGGRVGATAGWKNTAWGGGGLSCARAVATRATNTRESTCIQCDLVRTPKFSCALKFEGR